MQLSRNGKQENMVSENSWSHISTLTADVEMIEHVRKIVDLVSQAFGLCATGTNKNFPSL
jgi:hypothetical protein